MSESGDPASCPQGHEGAVRLLSVFASVGANGAAATATAAARPSGGGCGGGCACAH